MTEIKLDTNMMRGSAFEASNILTLEDLKVCTEEWKSRTWNVQHR